MTLQVWARDGRFVGTTIIRALPKESGFTDTKAFVPSDSVPKRILFDTNLGPVEPSPVGQRAANFLPGRGKSAIPGSPGPESANLCGLGQRTSI
jgi:hypothetical protein